MKRLRLLAFAASALPCLFVPQTLATILTFDLSPSPGDGGLVPQGYGDRVAAFSDAVGSYGVGAEGFTPNVLASYSHVNSAGVEVAPWVYFYGSGFADLHNVAWTALTGTFGLITLTPDPGYMVTLISFEAAGYGHDRPQSLILFSGGSVLLDFGAVVLHAGAHDTFLANVSAAGPISIFWGPSSETGGIDNIVFSQSVISTPDSGSTLALVGVAFAFAGAVRRKLRR